MKRILLPKPLQLVFKLVLVLSVFLACMIFARIWVRCNTQPAVAQVLMDNKLASENDKLRSQISAYNALLHQIWLDKPNYFEEALCESDEWLNLDKAVDGDFQGAFTFKSEEDSIAYYNNWDNGDATIRVVRHIIPAHTQEKLDKVFGNGD